MSVTFDEIIATYAALKLVEAKLREEARSSDIPRGTITLQAWKFTHSGKEVIDFSAKSDTDEWSGTRSLIHGFKSDLPYLIRKIAGMEE